MKKWYVFGWTLLLGVVLMGCNTSEDNASPNDGTTEENAAVENNDGVEANEGSSENHEEAPEANEDNPENHEEATEANEESDIDIEEGATESKERVIEGMNEEVEVVNYQFHPYDIAYQLDETMGSPEVEDHQVVHADGEYEVRLEVMEDASFDEVVANLQEEYESKEVAYTGELEDITMETSGQDGKAQIFEVADTTQGFYAYDLDDRVFVITYEYPVEAGDGMGPLLDAMQDSIKL